MKVYQEIYSFDEFDAWSGGADTLKDLDEEQQEQLFDYAEEIFPEGCSETELNDWLWSDRDSIYEYLGLSKDGYVIGSEEWVHETINRQLSSSDDRMYAECLLGHSLIDEFYDKAYVDTKDEDDLVAAFHEYWYSVWASEIAKEIRSKSPDYTQDEDIYDYIDNNAGPDDLYTFDEMYDGWLKYMAENGLNEDE